MSDKSTDVLSEERDRRVLELWERVVEIEERLIPTGLHVFGRALEGRECADLLRMVASFDRPESGARAQTKPFGDEVWQGACAALRPVEGGNHAQEVCALAPFERATEDVQARRDKPLFDLDDAFPKFEHAPVSLFARHVC